MQVIKPDMPLDNRLLCSGLLPEYFDALHRSARDPPMDQRKRTTAITTQAQTITPGQDYATLIRSNQIRTDHGSGIPARSIPPLSVNLRFISVQILPPEASFTVLCGPTPPSQGTGIPPS